MLEKTISPYLQLKNLAVLRAGKLLSNIYLGSSKNHEWECSKGHQWQATASNVKRGSWCPKCAGYKSLSEWFDLSESVVKEKAGKLLTQKSKFDHPRPRNLLVQCKEGHCWTTSAYVLVEEGKWCRKCMLSEAAKRRMRSIEEMQKWAEDRGGKCLSTEYKGIKTHLRWGCSKGHQWSAQPSNIQSGKWCPKCMKLNMSDRFRRKDGIAVYASLAAEKGGKLLTTAEPKNARQVLDWECARGHRWKAKANNVQNGRWCPTCSGGVGERICRIFFETLWGEPFPSSWPDWLRKDGMRRQLDGYCEKLKVAFEHQGQQHYRKLEGKKFSRVVIKEQKSEDQFKMVTCHKNGVALFHIPEIPSLTPLDQVKEVIRDQCLKKGISIPTGFDSKKIDLRKAWDYDLMERLHNVAKKRGGKCLGTDFIGVREKYLWECKGGHQWEASATSILHSKSWCPKYHHQWIAERIRTGIYKLPVTKPDPLVFEKMNQKATLRGGILLDRDYKGVCRKYKWKCQKGHCWEASGDSILHANTWCPYCARVRKSVKL